MGGTSIRDVSLQKQCSVDEKSIESEKNNMPEHSQNEENEKRSQLNPEHNFDTSHLKDTGQDSRSDSMSIEKGMDEEEEMGMGM